LITSAPIAPRCKETTGPARKFPQSSTRSPLSGPAAGAVVASQRVVGSRTPPGSQCDVECAPRRIALSRVCVRRARARRSSSSFCYPGVAGAGPRCTFRCVSPLALRFPAQGNIRERANRSNTDDAKIRRACQRPRSLQDQPPHFWKAPAIRVAGRERRSRASSAGDRAAAAAAANVSNTPCVRNRARRAMTNAAGGGAERGAPPPGSGEGWRELEEQATAALVLEEYEHAATQCGQAGDVAREALPAGRRSARRAATPARRAAPSI